mmetsp:Transcript_22717/g.52538  ORF Transcript_22717/g.52538 Transcript_22717/m.52538 type:complete len:165 (-) Transcript_22717:414-908(-)
MGWLLFTYLRRYNGEPKGAGRDIWLSILGEVYNVTKGPEYYEEGSGYHFFAGRDGSVPFITGNFTPYEGNKSTDVLGVPEVYALNQWREFYEKEKRYPFLGLLQGRFYDEDGNPTEELKRFRERLATYEHPVPRRRKAPKKNKAPKKKVPKENPLKYDAAKTKY